MVRVYLVCTDQIDSLFISFTRRRVDGVGGQVY